MTNQKKSTRGASSAAKRAAAELAPDQSARKQGDIIDRVRAELAAPIIPENLSDDEKERLGRARKLLSDAIDDTMALVRAVSERWRPQQSVWETPETAGPIIGDDEYDDLLYVIESVNEARVLRALGAFAGLPSSMMDEIVQEKLRAKLVPNRSAPQRNGVPVSIRKAKPKHQEDEA